jgi:hypothetical protein
VSTGETAAEVFVRIARQHYRIVRDKPTGELFGVPVRVGAVVPFTDLGGVLARLYERETRKVASHSTKTAAMEVLADHDAPEADVTSAPVESEEGRQRRVEEWWRDCSELAQSPRILDQVDEELRCAGFVGSTRVPRLVYLAACSSLLDVQGGTIERPVSVKIEGVSASGKNFAIELPLALLPAELIVRLTGLSERAIVYDDRPLAGCFLYFPEGGSIRDDSMAALLIRSLLTEGRVNYATVEKDERARLTTRYIERAGPTGAIIATSKVRLDRDLETRLIRLSVDDTEEQTRAVIEEIARKAATGHRPTVNHSAWHALFHWLQAQAPMRVRVPFAPVVAKAMPAVAVRLRRDAGQLFALVATHAALHYATRETDEDGCVVASLDDYEVVHELVDELLGASAGTNTPAWATETWDAIPSSSEQGISYAALGRVLGIGTDAARDRALKLTDLGHITNLETRSRVAARLVRADPLPEEDRFLPTSQTIRGTLDDDGTHTRTGEQATDPSTNKVRVDNDEPPPEPEPALNRSPEPSSSAGSGAGRVERTTMALDSTESTVRADVTGDHCSPVYPPLTGENASEVESVFAAQIAAGATTAEAAEAAGLDPNRIPVSLAPHAPEILRGVPYEVALDWEHKGRVPAGTAAIVLLLAVRGSSYARTSDSQSPRAAT